MSRSSFALISFVYLLNHKGYLCCVSRYTGCMFCRYERQKHYVSMIRKLST